MRFTRGIDNDKRHDDPNYDESDDEEELEAASSALAPGPAHGGNSSTSTVLHGEDVTTDLDLANREVYKNYWPTHPLLGLVGLASPPTALLCPMCLKLMRLGELLTWGDWA